MNKKISWVLDKIEKKGYEAYIVGGYTRDMLVGKTTYDIDICTNATPKELISIFPGASSKNLGGIEFKWKEYNFEITTYREEIKYQNRRPIKYNYVNNLFVDLNRRDFTINTICMNKKGSIIDLLDGCNDLNNMLIKMVGDMDNKLKEDPLRILRAIRIATVLNFQIDQELGEKIKQYKKEIAQLSGTRIKEELDKILISENVKRGLELLKEYGIADILGISYQDIVAIKNMEAMYAQIEIKYKLPFTKQEKENIKAIKEIIKGNDINKKVIYKYGLYLTRMAGAILNFNQKNISKMYKSLKIKDKKDIKIKASEIVKILEIDYSKKVGMILDLLEDLILSDKLDNKNAVIKKYLIDNKSRWG